MQEKRRLNLCFHNVLAIALLSACPRLMPAQGRGATLIEAYSTDAATDPRELRDSLKQLMTQLDAMNARLAEVAAAQVRSDTEAQQLRQELQAAMRRIEALESPMSARTPPASSPTSAPVSATPQSSSTEMQAKQNESIEERLSRIEENAQFLDAKLADQDQSKVESGGKYRLRLSGIFLLNLYGNIGAVDNQDFPALGVEQAPGQSTRAFAGSLRQSQVALEGFGPDLAGARTSADLRFDFAGNVLQESNGALMGGARLRTGVFRLDWKDTHLVAGQDALFFVPLTPTSLATLAVPSMSYSGNLWGWTPQVRLEQQFSVAENSKLLASAGVLDQLTGDVPPPGQSRYASWGEQSGQPGYAARVAWQQKRDELSWTLGAGGYYGRQSWGFGRTVDSWTGTVDLRLPVTRFLEFTSAFYRGRAVGGFGGAIGQTVLFSGDPGSAASGVHGLDSLGGWWQLKFKPTSNFEINTAFGQDNPYASELRQFPVVASEYEESLGRNQTWLVNFIYQLRSNVLLSTEYRHIATRAVSGEVYDANHLNLSLGYLF